MYVCMYRVLSGSWHLRFSIVFIVSRIHFTVRVLNQWFTPSLFQAFIDQPMHGGAFLPNQFSLHSFLPSSSPTFVLQAAVKKKKKNIVCVYSYLSLESF